MNRALARLDEYGAAQVMPAESRPDVRKPILKREAVGSLNCVLREQGQMQEGRN
ncbi:MAG: hypothetical protein M1582_04880 [Actinobacteria bacterium]|nr:hypothetical protein [Actinomycetota bacterium]